MTGIGKHRCRVLPSAVSLSSTPKLSLHRRPMDGLSCEVLPLAALVPTIGAAHAFISMTMFSFPRG